MKLISAESIHRPEVQRWHRRIIERYTPPPGIGLSVLLPCSARKPYSKSKSHMAFQGAIRAGAGQKRSLLHEAIITSPLGLVPRELEEVYPAAHYDVPVTGVWSCEESDFSIGLLKDYLGKTGAPAVAYAESDAYRDIFIACGVESVASDLAGLKELVEAGLAGVEGRGKLSNKMIKARAVCDFQFGQGAGTGIVRDGTQIKGFQVVDPGDGLVATYDRNNGFLALSLVGAARLYELGRYVVELSFRPKTGSIFCAGIESADHHIRPRDEVAAVYGGVVVGVGKAVLSGRELERSAKGLGLSLRHRSR
ncbi:PUA domain protein [archaeon BMS3Bbin16]|nr:PUA domain protein [archaeon BMS3Bbin16]